MIALSGFSFRGISTDPLFWMSRLSWQFLKKHIVCRMCWRKYEPIIFVCFACQCQLGALAKLVCSKNLVFTSFTLIYLSFYVLWGFECETAKIHKNYLMWQDSSLVTIFNCNKWDLTKSHLAKIFSSDSGKNFSSRQPSHNFHPLSRKLWHMLISYNPQQYRPTWSNIITSTRLQHLMATIIAKYRRAFMGFPKRA